MGLFSWLYSQPNPPQIPKVNTILPDAAVNEIKKGRLPRLKTDAIYSQKGEYIHYIDKAILLKDKTKRIYAGKRIVASFPGLFKGDRINIGGGTAEPIEEIVTEQFKGILYITNKRIIFVNKSNGFDKPFKQLSAITQYDNGIELQYGSTTYSLVVPDGDIPNLVIKMI